MQAGKVSQAQEPDAHVQPQRRFQDDHRWEPECEPIRKFKLSLFIRNEGSNLCGNRLKKPQRHGQHQNSHDAAALLGAALGVGRSRAVAWISSVKELRSSPIRIGNRQKWQARHIKNVTILRVPCDNRAQRDPFMTGADEIDAPRPRVLAEEARRPHPPALSSEEDVHLRVLLGQARLQISYWPFARRSVVRV